MFLQQKEVKFPTLFQTFTYATKRQIPKFSLKELPSFYIPHTCVVTNKQKVNKEMKDKLHKKKEVEVQENTISKSYPNLTC